MADVRKGEILPQTDFWGFEISAKLSHASHLLKEQTIFDNGNAYCNYQTQALMSTTLIFFYKNV